jgi:hypothetical protein
MENKTKSLVALWLADVFKRDDTGKIKVYEQAYRQAWGKPPKPPGEDLSENAYHDKENGKDGNQAAE